MEDNDPEFQYLAYLLYDLLSNESNGNFDTIEQTYYLLFTLDYQIFRDAMKTNKYTKNLSNFDTNKIPIEQQICLMKANDSVKEKAMLKLKEVKAKSEDSGSKARQYLDGLLKIPFGIFKKEKILTIMDDINSDFKGLIGELKSNDKNLNIPEKSTYSSIEIEKYSKYLKDDYIINNTEKSIQILTKKLTTGKRDMLISNICFINSIVKKHNLKKLKILHSGKKNDYMRKHIKEFIKKLNKYPILLDEFIKRYPEHFTVTLKKNISKEIENIDKQWLTVNDTMTDIKTVLDKSIYGHNRAKRQIERVSQWITGKQVDIVLDLKVLWKVKLHLLGIS